MFKLKKNFNYKDYWEKRYKKGGNSGIGSYGELANFKADVINNYIQSNNIDTAIEFGCGDGNNQSLYQISNYIGLDISKTIIDKNNLNYSSESKYFMYYNPSLFFNNKMISADLTMCLDVLYHIIDEEDYYLTLDNIVNSSKKYIILYTVIKNLNQKTAEHLKYRDTLKDLEKYNFRTIEVIEQKYPDKSSADFILITK